MLRSVRRAFVDVRHDPACPVDDGLCRLVSCPAVLPESAPRHALFLGGAIVLWSAPLSRRVPFRIPHSATDFTGRGIGRCVAGNGDRSGEEL